jgi:hypothetical protein
MPSKQAEDRLNRRLGKTVSPGKAVIPSNPRDDSLHLNIRFNFGAPEDRNCLSDKFATVSKSPFGHRLPYDNDALPEVRFPTYHSVPNHLLDEMQVTPLSCRLSENRLVAFCGLLVGRCGYHGAVCAFTVVTFVRKCSRKAPSMRRVRSPCIHPELWTVECRYLSFHSALKTCSISGLTGLFFG